MKIQFLGTSATERIPALFCECEVCEKSRKAGGKNIRTRSQALVDNCILIDFPSDTFMHFAEHNVPFKNIKSCLITHSHLDHLYAEETVLRKRRFSYVYEDPSPLVFYGDVSAVSMIEIARTKSNIPESDYKVSRVYHGKEIMISDHKVVPLKAVHAPDTTPLLYIIEKDGKSLFYSTDTSEYPEETFEYLKNISKPLNLIALDCTYACNVTDCTGHLDFHRCVSLKNELIKIGAADENTKFVLTHFSHNGANVMYDEFVEIANEKGFITAYDGMTIEL